MRQLMVALLSLLISYQAVAFKDPAVVNGIIKLKQNLETQPRENRLVYLEKFKNALYKRLNTIPLPENILQTPANDPRMEEFRSLNEFSGYVNLISPKSLDRASCQSAQQSIVSAAKTQDETAGETDTMEADEAAKILEALCK